MYSAGGGISPGIVIDPLGNETGLLYNKNGQIKTVVPPQGEEHAVTTTYYGDGAAPASDAWYGQAPLKGRIYQTAAPGGDTTTYGYKLSKDASGRLVYEETCVKSSTGTQPPQGSGGQAEYSYTRVDAAGNVLESWSSTRGPADPQYATSGREDLVTHEYDAEGRNVYSRTGDGDETWTDYDVQGRAWRTVHSPAQAQGEHRPSTISTTTYDAFGRVVETRSVDEDGRELSKSATEYVELPRGRGDGDPPSLQLRQASPVIGRLEIRTDSRGAASESEYDKGGRLVASRRYLPDGRLADQTSYEYDAAGRQIATVDIDGNRSETVYDEFGRVVQSIANAGTASELVTQTGYDVGGRTTWSQSPTGAYTINEYKADAPNLGVLIKVNINQASLTPDGQSFLEYQYDSENRRTAERDAEGRWTATHYDSEGRVAAVIMNWDTTTTVTGTTPPLVAADPTSDENLRFEFDYDSDGRQTKIRKPNGAEIEKVYDTDGRLHYEFGPVCDDNNGPGLNRRTVAEYEYDLDGRIKIEWQGTASAAKDNIVREQRTEYEYDRVWKRVSEKKLYKGATLERWEKYTYSEKYGDLVKVETFDGSGNKTRTVTYEYDSITGSIVGTNGPEGRIEYDYDVRGRLTRIRTSTGIDTRYTYNQYGQIASIADDGMGGEIKYEYDNYGRKDRITRPNGTVTEYGYENLTGWLDSIVHKDSSSQTLLGLDYIRNKTGIIDQITETRDGGTHTWGYSYDGLDRLTQATLTTGQTTEYDYQYDYDRNGNRTWKSVAVGGGAAVETDYSYNALDQLTQTDTGTDTTTYSYDSIGRLITEKLNSTTTRNYGWSVDDRLLSVSLPQEAGSPVVNYSYDHEGRRVARWEDGVGKQYLQDNQNPTGYSQTLTESSGDGTQVEANYYYGDSFGPMAQAYNPESPEFDLQFLLGDHLSTTRGLTDSAGAYNGLLYSPFGDILAGNGSLTNYAFTGQWKDGTSGLQHHRARWLDTGIGRWTSVDPVFDWRGNNGLSYAYLTKRTINDLDPHGTGPTYTEMTGAQAIALVIASIGLGAYAGYKEYAQTKSYVAAGVKGLEVFSWSLLLGSLMFTPAAPIVIFAIFMMFVADSWNVVISGAKAGKSPTYIAKDFFFEILLPILIFLSMYIVGLILLRALFPGWYRNAPSSQQTTIQKPATNDLTVSNIAEMNSKPMWERLGLEKKSDASGAKVYRGVSESYPDYEKNLTGEVPPWGEVQSPKTRFALEEHDAGYGGQENSGVVAWTTDIDAARVYARGANGNEGGIILKTTVPDGHGVFFGEFYNEYQVLIEGTVKGAEVVERIPAEGN